MKNTHNFPKIEGKYINLREAEVGDSAFILSLRTDSKKSRYIHKTKNDLEAQMEYMERYKAQNDEWYFIVEDKQGNSLGTNRIGRYPLWHPSLVEKDDIGVLSPASWLMASFANPLESLESDSLQISLMKWRCRLFIRIIRAYLSITNLLAQRLLAITSRRSIIYFIL